MNRRVAGWFRRYWAAFVLVLLVGCSLPLVPPYDKAVIDALNVANTETMTLFASVDKETKQYDYANRAERYAQVIGKWDALIIAANARPVPKNQTSDRLNHLLDRMLPASANTEEFKIPSVYAMKKISETITKMRETDMKQGLTSYEVIAFKQQVIIYLDQAITYENFLQR